MLFREWLICFHLINKKGGSFLWCQQFLAILCVCADKPAHSAPRRAYTANISTFQNTVFHHIQIPRYIPLKNFFLMMILRILRMFPLEALEKLSFRESFLLMILRILRMFPLEALEKLSTWKSFLLRILRILRMFPREALEKLSYWKSFLMIFYNKGIKCAKNSLTGEKRNK